MNSNPESESQSRSANAGESTIAAAEALTPDPLVQIQAGLEAVKAESEQWRDRFLRKAAELENYRKRAERERAEAAVLVQSSVLIEFLPIMDACELALERFKEEAHQPEKLQKYKEGVELLYRQLTTTLNRLGVTALEAKGQKFDPHLHEALMHMETVDHEDNTVVQELRRGYMLKDRLLRPSQVIVASRPKTKDGSQASS